LKKGDRHRSCLGIWFEGIVQSKEGLA
jgi:hypothetical protein